jgi:hypothetical protein
LCILPRGGSPPKPKAQRRNRAKPQRGEYHAAAGIGWQHGEVPPPPEGLLPATITAWQTWMGAWFAAHWTPEDVPGLRQLARLYDQLERGEYQRHGEYRLSADTYGITPKGQQDRRWIRPIEEAKPSPSPRKPRRASADRFAHLRVVNE